jgi:hypothetical protein
MRGRLLLWVDLGLKALLVGLLAFGAFSGLEQFEGKAFGWRLLTYPLATVIVPVGWLLAGKPRPYPYAMDMLLVAPFLIDVAGNALDLYDSIDWWDDFNHFLNWGLLTAAFAQLLVRLRVGRVELAGLAIGFGATTAILWELGEYFAFIRGGSEETTAYTDTLGDLSLGLTGSVVAALLTVCLTPARCDEPAVPELSPP